MPGLQVAAKDWNWEERLTFPLFMGILASSGYVSSGKKCFCLEGGFQEKMFGGRLTQKLACSKRMRKLGI